MTKISTPEDLIPALFSETHPPMPDDILDRPDLIDEWQQLMEVKELLSADELLSPSQTSVDIIMAYALGKEERAASY